MARELADHCVDAARGRGVARLSLGTPADTPHLYESLGFSASTTEMTMTPP
ncbi:hypothetical protein [Deinococcus arenicola]|uniref:hypothetical protein n=1 Tax=Deinococcus arenicola TaxID=2994950 RepID=UPI0029555A2D|nr:hypothetical protein [Deinococcus sp. ZS9-10]